MYDCYGQSVGVLGFVQFAGFQDGLSITLALLVVNLLSYRFYPVSLERFASCGAFFICLLVSLHIRFAPSTFFQILFLILFFTQFALAAFLFTSGQIRSVYMPVGYALIGALAVTVLWMSWEGAALHSLTLLAAPTAKLISIMLGIFLAVWVCRIVPERQKLFKTPVVLAFPAIALLAWVGIPALLFVLWVLVLGYARGDKHLVALGLALIPFTLFLFYYNLSLSLLHKSGLLIASGLILLAVSGYLYSLHRKADQQCS